MTYDMRTLQDFLAGLTPAELSQTRGLITEILSNKQILQQVETGKRPHIAMPERRGGDRYRVKVVGQGWDALKVFPTDNDKNDIIMGDISDIGCSFTSETRYHPSQILSLECRTPRGQDQKIYVEVVRARRLLNTRPPTYEMGCRTVDETHVAHARQFIDHQKFVRSRLDDHLSIRVVMLCGGSDCQPVQDYSLQHEYDIRTVTLPSEIIAAVTAHRADVVISPSSAIGEDETPWLNELRREFPAVSVVGLGPNEECGRVRTLGVEQSVVVSQISAQVRIALERALYDKLVRIDEGLKPRAIKVIIAGRDEKHMRRLQTLLFEKKYHISKCPSPGDILRELEMQKYDILIAAAEFFSETDYDIIADLRRDYPSLVVVIDTDDAAEARNALARDADLILPSSATRAELFACIEKANQALFSKTFVH